MGWVAHARMHTHTHATRVYKQRERCGLGRVLYSHALATHQLKLNDFLCADNCADVFLSIAGSQEAEVLVRFGRRGLSW